MGPSMLTTIDNPYHPFHEFDEWFAFDEQKGYHTCSYLARVTISSNELSEADDMLAQETAIDEILEHDVFGIYRRIREKDKIKKDLDNTLEDS